MRINFYPTLCLKSLLLLVISLFHLQSKGQSQTDKIHIGFIYPISTHGTHAPQDTNIFSYHLLAGVSAEEKGVSFAGLTNVIRNNAQGVQFAGFSNHVGKNSKGLLFAGFANTYKGAEGLQFAGFVNAARTEIKGGQFAGFINTAGNTKGTQFGGFANVAKDIIGTQFGGFINVAKEVKGTEFAGFANIAGNVKGTQFAGFLNKAGDVKGSQFAGFINIAKKVKGGQLAGFINIADSSDHPFGIVNIIKNGEKGIGVSIDENATTFLTFRSGGKTLYGILGVGYNFENEREVYALEAGFGAHLSPSKNFRINVELAQTTLESFETGEYFKASARFLPAFKFAKGFEIFGGPVFNYVNTNTDEGKSLTGNYIWDKSRNNNFQAFYFGYMAGVQVLF